MVVLIAWELLVVVDTNAVLVVTGAKVLIAAFVVVAWEIVLVVTGAMVLMILVFDSSPDLAALINGYFPIFVNLLKLI